MGDSYSWTGNGDGASWSDPNNWKDTTTSDNPATKAPGSGDEVFLANAALSSGGAAADLTTTGSVGLNGADITAALIDNGGDVTINGGTLESDGLLDDENGASITLNSGSLKANSMTNDGTVEVTGAGSTLTTNVQILVGSLGSGELDIKAGGSVSAGSYFSIGGDAGDSGTVTIDGANSSLSSTSTISVGVSGDGSLTLTNGASAQTGGDLQVGWLNSNSPTVGGTGTFVIETGSTAQSDYGDIGGIGGSDGTVTIDGAGSEWTITNQLLLGDAGSGSLTIENSATLISQNTDGSTPSVDMGVQSTGHGTMTVSGNPTDVNLEGGGGITVGDAGTGTLDIVRGATLEVSNADPQNYWALVVGSQSGSDGMVTVDGQGSTLTVGYGGLSVGEAGTGSVTVSHGGTLDVTDTSYGLNIGTDDGATGAVDVTGAGSTLDVAYTIAVGDGGAGSLTIENAGTLTSQNTDGATPSLDIGVQSTGNGTMTVADGGTDINLDGGGAIVGDAGTGALDIARGATLEVSNADPQNYWALVVGSQSGSDGTLTIDGQGSTLAVGDGGMSVGSAGGGSVTVSHGAELIVDGTDSGLDVGGHGAIDLEGGTLIAPLLTVEAQGTLSGYGTVEGSSGGSDPGALTNDGTITAVGGVLSISDDITTGTGASGNFAIASGATLEFSGSVDTGQTVAFSGSNADLTLDQPGANGANFNPFIEDFFSTDQISIDNFAASSVSYVGGSYVLSDGSTQVDLDFGSAQSISTLSYKVSGGDTIVTTDVAPCYCRGTLILADAGEVAVQDLKIGDLVLTSSGAARPIKWIGRRSYGGRFAMGRKDILPVCIKAGALDDRVPRRDLWISPHHAMYLEGVLIEAQDLLNGVSIVQAERIDTIEYFHIELETHDVIVAEGALSESFIDDDSRGMFHNAHEYAVCYPETQTGRMQYCAPRCEDGFEIEAARQRIALRAGQRTRDDEPGVGTLRGYVDLISRRHIAGWAQNTDHPEAPVCLDIYAGGQLIGQALANSYRKDLKQAGLGSGRHSFAFTPPEGLVLTPASVMIRRSLDGAVLLPSADARRAAASDSFHAIARLSATGGFHHQRAAPQRQL